MALKLSYAMASVGAAVDQQTGSMSIFEVIEEVRTPQLPMQLQSLVLSLSLEKTDSAEFTGKLMIHLLTPDGKQQMIGSGDMEIPAEQKRMRAVFRYGNFPLASFGRHRLVISWLNAAGAKVGEALVDFDVVQTTQVAQGVTKGDKEHAH